MHIKNNYVFNMSNFNSFEITQSRFNRNNAYRVTNILQKVPPAFCYVISLNAHLHDMCFCSINQLFICETNLMRHFKTSTMLVKLLFIPNDGLNDKIFHAQLQKVNEKLCSFAEIKCTVSRPRLILRFQQRMQSLLLKIEK